MKTILLSTGVLVNWIFNEAASVMFEKHTGITLADFMAGIDRAELNPSHLRLLMAACIVAGENDSLKGLSIEEVAQLAEESMLNFYIVLSKDLFSPITNKNQ